MSRRGLHTASAEAGTAMTDAEITQFRAALTELLEDETCKSFIEGVLSQISDARRPASSENALDIFDKVTA